MKNNMNQNTIKESVTKIEKVLSFSVPEGQLHYDYCRTCGYWDRSDKTPDGRCFCSRMGGYHSGGDGCGYHT